MKDNSYQSVLARRNMIMKEAIGIDYSQYAFGSIGFDYEQMMAEVAYPIDEIRKIQQHQNVGNTPLLSLRHLTKLVRKCSEPGMGASLYLKDEASNPSGSFKARRAAISVYQAKKMGYEGVIAATSGNYGAAVASQAAMQGLKCIIVQETYDSRGIGQPEIIEKARKCEAFGAEVVQMSVGPELFYQFLLLLEETGYFNASLYSPYGIAGIETLGVEIEEQMRALTGKSPDVVVCTNAGGGNLTGTARGLIKAGARHTKVVAASVDLKGLHMASDHDFNLKSFTTGHTGFGLPFATLPDRSDVPRSAARPLRYMDQYLTVKQGEVFYMTEALAQLEGLERGPAGNISLAAAFSLAQTLPESATVVVQETEYTGAGKHLLPQLSFAKTQGISVLMGDPKDEIPGKTIVIPKHPTLIKAEEFDVQTLKEHLIRNLLKSSEHNKLTAKDLAFLSDETRTDLDFVNDVLKRLV